MTNDCENEEYSSQALDEATYLAARTGYDQAELEISGRYDKWILTLSGGALAISITFIEKIANHPTAETLIWLKFSWASFVVALLISLYSLLSSQSAIRENRDELDSSYREGRSPMMEFRKLHTYLTNLCNWGSLFAFIIGVIFLCVFSFKNIDKSITIEGEKNEKNTEKTIVGHYQNGDWRICSINTTKS